MVSRKEVTAEFFAGSQFGLPSDLYVAMSEICFAGLSLEAVSTDLQSQGVTMADISPAEKAHKDAIVYRVGLRAFNEDAIAGNNDQLTTMYNRLRQIERG